jgi:GNAT superfamily N-acetyltransferase
MPTSSAKTYTTTSIPRDCASSHLDALAVKFRNFKLDALLSAPEAFSAEFDSESQLPHSTWLSRITESSTTILVCVATNTYTDEYAPTLGDEQIKTLLEGEWTGTFTLIGPVSRAHYIWPESGQPEPGPEGSETRWQLTSLFTLPAYRGLGIAKRLTEAAVEFGKNASNEMSRATGRVVRTRVRLIVHPKNTGVVKMYEKFGFKDSARMTVAEACFANGAGDMVPINADPEKWHSRFGVAMEILV